MRQKESVRYASRSYANPYFARKKRQVSIKLPEFNIGFRTKLYLAGFVLLCVAMAATALYSGYFSIDNITVKGAERISEKSVTDLVEEQKARPFLFIFNQNNILFFNKGELSEALNAKYAFENLEVKKKFPGTIVITFQEKSYAVIWQEDDQYYYADNTGHIIEGANLLEVGERDYPIISNETGVKTLGTQTEADPAYISRVTELFNKIKEYPDMKIERFIKDNDVDSIKIKLNNGPLLLINANDDLGKQVERINLIKDEKLKDDFVKKEYIDVRYGNSVYYK